MQWSFEAHKPEIAAQVRKEMIAHLAQTVSPEGDLGDAEMIIGELLSNAVLHGGGHIRAIIRAQDFEAFITVCDEGPYFEIMRPRSLRRCNIALNEHGRGMFIIAALGRYAKVHRLGEHKAVTVQIQIPDR